MLAELILDERILMKQSIIIYLSLLKYLERDFEDTLTDLDWCAKNKADDEAIETIKHLAESLLSAYEIQRSTY